MSTTKEKLARKKERETGDRLAKLEAQVERWKKVNAGKASRTERRLPETKVKFTSVADVMRAWLAKRGITSEKLREIEQRVIEHEMREARERTQARREARWERMCPAIYREPFYMAKVNQSVNRDKVLKALRWKFGPRGLWVIGKTGHSKTRAMFTLLRRVAIDEARTACVVDGIEFALMCSNAFRETETAPAFFRSMVQPDILFIDDVAKRLTPATQQGLFAVLEKRSARGKPLLLTTNVTGEQLDEMINDQQISEPLRRRLREFCEVCVF